MLSGFYSSRRLVLAAVTGAAMLPAAVGIGRAAKGESDKPKVVVGEPAPTFKAIDQNEQARTLDEFKGRWLVLYFYPKDDTPGCTIEACDFRDGLQVFSKLDAVVIGCSPDSVASHRRFIEKHDLTIDLLADTDQKVLGAYGAWVERERNGEKVWGVQRSTVIIDPDGKVAHHWPQVNPRGHVAEVKVVLEKIKAEREKSA